MCFVNSIIIKQLDIFVKIRYSDYTNIYKNDTEKTNHNTAIRE